MLTTSATAVRKDWGGFIDSVVREKPRMIKRSRDYVLAILACEPEKVSKELFLCQAGKN